jgi:hypothetical protein
MREDQPPAVDLIGLTDVLATIAAADIKDLYILPLEIVEGVWLPHGSDEFREAAKLVEMKWMDRLHSHNSNLHGLNMKIEAHNLPTPPELQSHSRIFGFRNSRFRIQALDKRMARYPLLPVDARLPQAHFENFKFASLASIQAYLHFFPAYALGINPDQQSQLLKQVTLALTGHPN